jgi:FkbM family methyltransferase
MFEGQLRAIGLFLKRSPRLLTRIEEAAGWWWDHFGGYYKVGALRFEIPDDGTSRRFRARFTFGLYEYSERRLIGRWLPRDAVVLELGGGFGVVSGVINRRLANPKAHVVLEANPVAAAILRRNRARNGCGFEIVEAFLGDAAQKTFWLKSDIIGFGEAVRRGRRIEAAGVTLAALEARTGLRFDTLILDIEGGEVDAMAHVDGDLARVDLVILELHPGLIGDAACDAVRDRLSAAGLRRVDRIGDTEAWKRP